VDSGCLSYGMIDSHFATKHRLERISINPRSLIGFESASDSYVSEVAVMSIDIDGHCEDKAYFYVVLS